MILDRQDSNTNRKRQIMADKKFNYSMNDSQGTIVDPLPVKHFDIEEYRDYEQDLNRRCADFRHAEEGVAVYRRFRVPQVFSYGCRDMKNSLELQLGCLDESMKYKADIPNFIEPWYGIGTIASAFGADYDWRENQAPVVKPPFKSIAEALNHDYVDVEKTAIGKHTLEMIDYFVTETKGRIPISFTDTQSPLDTAAMVLPMTKLCMEMYNDPEGYKQLLAILSDLLISFTKKQEKLIGETLVKPGHGFASSREFSGLGMSDDYAMMVSDDFLARFEQPFREQIGAEFGGCVFHSCGNWASRISAVKKISNLIMVDAAFSAETDPDHNRCEPFAEQFANSGIVVNARIVGDPDTIADKVRKLWRPGMKLIVVTYCQSPAEQKEAYDRIHAICAG